MKQLMPRVLTALFMIVLLGAGTASAQSTAVIKVNIPFEFALGDKTFPAGDYSLVQPLQHILVLRNERGQTIATTVATGVELSSAPAISKLRFVQVDGQYALAEVWQQDDTAALQINSVAGRNRSYIAKRSSPQVRQAAEGSQP